MTEDWAPGDLIKGMTEDERLNQMGGCVETLIKALKITRECGFDESDVRANLVEAKDQLTQVLLTGDHEPEGHERVMLMLAAVKLALA